MPRAVIVGTGGQARIVAAIGLAAAEMDVVGLLDTSEADRQERILGLPVLGDLRDLEPLRREGVDAVFLAVGDNGMRRRLFERAQGLGFQLPALVHPAAFVELTAVLGPGSVVCAFGYVGVEARIGPGVIVNTHASVDHETLVGAFASISPAVSVAGRCTIGDEVFIGSGATVSRAVAIGDRARIGAGAAVLAPVAANSLVVGVPAREK